MCRCRPSSAPELAKCGLNRAVADGDLSITHLQVARESWWRRSHISWNDCRRRRRLRLLDMQARRGEAKGGGRCTTYVLLRLLLFLSLRLTILGPA